MIFGRTDKLVDLQLRVVGETEKALRVSDGVKAAWLPKRLVEDNGDGTLTMPYQLAFEKELI